MRGPGRTHLPTAILLATCPIAFAIGCAETPVAVRPDLNSMKAVGILYGKYVGAHNGQPPKSEKEFVQYVAAREREFLKQLGLSDPEQLVISPRSGQPLVLVTTKTGPTDISPIVAYESQPVDGTRLVVRDTGVVQELPEVEFQRQRPSA